MKTRSHVLATAVLCLLETARAGICEDRASTSTAASGSASLDPGLLCCLRIDLLERTG